VLYGERVPEPEIMDDADEISAYAGAAAEAHLARLDEACVAHALSLGVREGLALDAGCGPGGMALLLARRAPGLSVLGIDVSPRMVAEAGRAAREAGLAGRARFLVGDSKRLGLESERFDLVLSNSVLHHLSAPLPALNEAARVLRPGGALLLRDLRRPHRALLPLHLAWHGRAYRGTMRRLFEASVRAAYSEAELADLLRRSTIRGARLFREGSSHIGIERPASA
jgi:SAM-dependent methyltransferase